jgi:hypothetical protein
VSRQADTEAIFQAGKQESRVRQAEEGKQLGKQVQAGIEAGKQS